jgi:hypothetical protein
LHWHAHGTPSREELEVIAAKIRAQMIEDPANAAAKDD